MLSAEFVGRIIRIPKWLISGLPLRERLYAALQPNLGRPLPWETGRGHDARHCWKWCGLAGFREPQFCGTVGKPKHLSTRVADD